MMGSLAAGCCNCNNVTSEIAMLRIFKTLALSNLLMIAVLATVPKVGDTAPQFSLPSTKGTSVALKDYNGKSKVVLVFYRGYW